jgi:hypothetical protein
VDVGERSIVVHHAMPTPNCNTSNTRVFDPFNPPTSRSQHLLAPHLIHGTVEQCILVLFLLLTNLPLDGVAPTGWPEGHPRSGRHHPRRAEVVLTNEVDQQPPGVYECRLIVAENAYHALSRHELDPPLRLRIVEHPDDVRQGPEFLSVGTFW